MNNPDTPIDWQEQTSKNFVEIQRLRAKNEALVEALEELINQVDAHNQYQAATPLDEIEVSPEVRASLIAAKA